MNREALCRLMLSAMECPFCGSTELKLIDMATTLWIRCNACNANGPTGISAEQALEHWNWTGHIKK